MKPAWKGTVAAFAAGLIFAVGLGISGMTQPGKVMGFLDFAGAWDPSLAFVMVGAIGVYLPIYRVASRRHAPFFAPIFSVPARGVVDRRLVIGAVLFGLGWGLSGFCPGPALTSIASGRTAVLVFVAGMLSAMVVFGMFGGVAHGRRGDA